MKRLITAALMLMLLNTSILWAQERAEKDSTSEQSYKEFYLPFGAAYTFSFGRDDGVSPMIYRGHIGVFRTGFYDYRPHGYHKVDMSLAGGIAKQSHSDVLNGNLQQYRAYIDYTYVHHIKDITAWPLGFYLGGSWYTGGFIRYHSKYSNNFLNYEAATHLALTPAFRKKLQLFGRRWHIDARLALPFIAAYVRPDYVTPYTIEMRTSDSEVKGFLKSAEIAGPVSYKRLTAQFSLNYFLLNGNSLMLTYKWDYYHIKSVNPVKQGFHTIGFLTHFNLN